jgi:urease accessory protein
VSATIVTDRPIVEAQALLGLERDVLVLTAEERRWGRRRARTTAGRELVLALPTGSVLAPGEVLHLDREWYVVVEPAMEALLAVVPRSTRELARVAFEVGNRHFTLAWHEGRVLVPDDPAMEQLLKRLEMPFERICAVFEPLGRGHRHD